MGCMCIIIVQVNVILNTCIFSHVVIALVNKHYSAILKSFPDDFSITRKKIHTYAQETDCLSPNLSSVNPQVYNEVIFNKLINELLSPDEKMTPQNFGFVVFMLVGDTPAVKELQKGMFL